MKIKSTILALAAFSALGAVTGHAAIIAQQNFEITPAAPTATFTTTGTSEFNTGVVTGTFSPSTSTWGVASSRGISFTTNAGSITFAAINTVGLTDINLTLRLAALSINSTANGMDAADNFILAVSVDNGVTFSNQLQINGNTNARWSFSDASGSASRAYTTAAATVFTPASGGVRTTDGFTNLSVTDLPAVANLVVRVTATDNDVNERWLVDNYVLNAIPEPSTALLGAFGMLALLRRRR